MQLLTAFPAYEQVYVNINSSLLYINIIIYNFIPKSFVFSFSSH